MADKYKAGYWAFWRKYLDSELLMHEGLLKLWVICMTRANWVANSVKLDGVTQPVKLGPGQFISGRYNLHGEYHRWKKGYEKLSPCPRTIWNWLKTLEKMKFLAIKSTNKFSIITMANWPTEQTEKQKVASNFASSLPSACHREEVNKNKEGVKKETPILAFKKKDKGDSRSCEACRKSFIPTKHWHTVCDVCYEPGDKGGARPELLNKKCQSCGLEASNVVDGFCPFCEGKESNKS